MKNKSVFIHTILLLCILLFAFAVRIYHIDTVPPGLYPDEANNAQNALDALSTLHYQWFYPDNNGREGLFINLMALTIKFFGTTLLGVKLPSIILGVLTVLGTYLLARELFPSKHRIALISAYLITVSFWAINFSRIGFRAILMLPIITFSLYFIFRGLRRNRYRDYIFAGMLFGLGFHSYIAFRIAPALLIVLFVLLLLIDGRFVQRYWRAIALFVVSAILVAAPLFYTLSTHPQYAGERTSDVGIFSLENRQEIPRQLAQSAILSLAKFNVYGDPNFRHNYAPYPLLEPLTGIAFLAGLIIALKQFFHFLMLRMRHNIRNRNLVIYGLLLAWFVLFLLPEMLTYEGLPHALRSIGTLPVVYLFAAISINALIDWVVYKRQQTRVFLLTIIGIFLLFVGVFNTLKYHVFWAQNPKTATAFHKDLHDIVTALPTYPPYKEKIIIAGPLERLSVSFFVGDDDHVHYKTPQEVSSLTLQPHDIIFVPQEHADTMKQLPQTTPPYITEKHLQKGASVFYTIHLPAQSPSISH